MRSKRGENGNPILRKKVGVGRIAMKRERPLSMMFLGGKSEQLRTTKRSWQHLYYWRRQSYTKVIKRMGC